MLGAIIGDIVGSRFEWNNNKSKEFELFTSDCFFTDDSIMTIGVAKAILESKDDYFDLDEQTIKWLRIIGRPYPNSGYGANFYNWMYSDNPTPYNSFGNGAAMRVSAVSYASKSLEDAEYLAYLVSSITHNHEEGIKGAKAVASAIYLAKLGFHKSYIKQYIEDNYYDLDFTIDSIRDSYQFNETCQETVPQALEAFFESKSFVDAIRIAISLGGDSDTIAAITGSVAEAYYGIFPKLRKAALSYLDERLKSIVLEFEKAFPFKVIKKKHKGYKKLKCPYCGSPYAVPYIYGDVGEVEYIFENQFHECIAMGETTFSKEDGYCYNCDHRFYLNK